MSESQNWVEALNISPESLTDWSAQVPDGVPLLVWCLEQGHISPDAYLNWAVDHFGLAKLQSAYFASTFDRGGLETARQSGDWQPWCFPVGEWEGTSFVACVEPPPEPQTNCVYILADPRAMRTVWDGGEVHAQDGAPPPVPEMPAGMSLETKPFTLNLDEATFNIGPVTEIKTFTEPPAPASETVVTPMDLSLPELEFPSASPLSEEPPAVAPAAVTPEPPVMKSAPPAPAVKATAPPAPVPPAATKTPAPPVPKTAAKPPELKIVSDEAPAAPAQAQPAPTPKPAPKPAPAKARAAAPTGVNEDEAITALFEDLKRRYQSAVIMKCSEQTARVYRWDESLNVSDEDKATINLSYPTFMRIVAKTNLPYHGYLIDSPAHREFFGALGLSELPPCVTALPVRFDNRMWGMVVAFGSEDNQKMDSLNFALEVAERLLNDVGALWAKAG